MNRKKYKVKKPTAHYDLEEVRALIARNRVNINGDVLDDAENDFCWNSDDILDAMCKLRPSMFHKKDVLRHNTSIVIDVYRGKVNGENIYTHFYIIDGQAKDGSEDELTINSFKNK